MGPRGDIQAQALPCDRRCGAVLKFNAYCVAESSETPEAREMRSAALVRQIEPDMQLTELSLRDFGWRAHHQILGALIHGEQHDLAQVLLAGQKHHDAVDSRCYAAMGRRAERKRAQH